MKKTNFLLIVFLLFNTISICQIVDIDYHPNLTPLMSVEDSLRQAAEQNKPQFLKNGFVDFVSDGSIQASARLLRINIGEMNKFYLPLFIYTGASGKTFGHDKLNQTTVSNLLNPIGGTLNVSFNGLQNLIRSRKGQITKLKFGYQFGGRLVNGNDSIIKDNINFFNGFFNFGFFFQTGAWVSEDPSNMGVFYLQANFTSSFSSKSDIQKIFE